jgi:glycosyltransferase involved in cell wall biosynthesis
VRVMHVIDSLALGGAERMAVELANRCAQDGNDVSLCATRRNGPLAALLDSRVHLEVLGRRSRLDLGPMWRHANDCRTRNAELFHVHGRSSFSLMAALCGLRLTRGRLLLHDHTPLKPGDVVPTWFRTWGRHWVGHYVGVSEMHRDWARGAGIADARVSVIPNAIALEPFRAAEPADLRKELGIDMHVPLGIVVGNLRAQKGIDLLIAAMSSTKSPAAALATFVIVGRDGDDPDYGALCRREAARLGNRVRFLGARNDVPRLLRAADFAVVPSRYESGPLTLIEAMAAGLPVIGTCVGDIGLRAHALGVEGLVPPGDTNGLAAAIDTLLGLSREVRAARGRIAQAVAFEQFDIATVMKRWYDLYKSPGARPN